MSQKTWGKTVKGWFVESESKGEEPASSEPTPSASVDAADALIAKYAGGPAAPAARRAAAPVAAPPIALKGPLPTAVAGQIDFDKVYELAGVDAAERDRVNKARDLLRSLPAETPLPVKKQIVEASLKAFGVPTEKIIEAAVESVEALESFILTGQSQTQNILEEGAARIGDLETQIAEVKKAMQSALDEQAMRTSGSNQKKLEMQEVLEFFGQEAVGRVVVASPKLHEPT